MMLISVSSARIFQRVREEAGPEAGLGESDGTTRGLYPKTRPFASLRVTQKLRVTQGIRAQHPLAFCAPSGNIGLVWNLRRTVAWLVLLPLAILAALILSLPLILNSADYQALLISQAQDQLGRKVEMKRAHVEVFPYVRMTLDDVVIREADGQDEFLSTEHLFIDLRIFPLLKRKVLAKRIALDMPKVKIKRGPDGKLNISDLFAATADTTRFPTPLLAEQLSIADGEIAFEDTYGSTLPRTVAFRHVNTTVKRTGMHLGYRFFAAVPQETGDATITVTGAVARQAIEQAGVGGRATGRVEAKRVDLAQLAPFLNDNMFLRGVQTPVDLAASYEYRWATGTRA